MTHVNKNMYTEMFSHFSQLGYAEKLRYFDTHFGIIPFSFPAFNLHVSWYSNPKELALIIENFYKERPKKIICEKTFTENGCVIRFNVHPVYATQRIQYNQFIISAFLKDGGLHKKIEHGNLRAPDGAAECLTSQICALAEAERWRTALVTCASTKTSLQNQFLQVMFSGLHFYSSGRTLIIQQRRKFVELYLFSYGLFLAARLTELKHLPNEQQQACQKFPVL